MTQGHTHQHHMHLRVKAQALDERGEHRWTFPFQPHFFHAAPHGQAALLCLVITNCDSLQGAEQDFKLKVSTKCAGIQFGN